MKKVATQLKKFLSLGIVISSIYSFHFTSEAQEVLNTANDSVRIVVTPQNPKPLDEITIRLDSSLIDLSDANVSWFVNNRLISEGRDNKTFKTKLGNVGVNTNIKISINSKNYGIVNKELNFRLGRVDILYEAETFTPPFYKGKALASPQSFVKAIAIPELTTSSSGRIATKDLVFTWKKNGEVDGLNSGRGKSTYRFNVGNLPTNSPVIEVLVSSLDGSIEAYGNIVVPHQNPEIVFYEENALLGVELQRALGDIYTMRQPETTVVAYPYFFSAKFKDSSNLRFAWTINSTSVTPKSDSVAKITLRKPDGKGNSYLSLNIDHKNQIFQTSNSGVNFEYGN